MNVPLPPFYDGSRKEFTHFWHRVRFYMDGNEELFTSDKKRITFVLSFLNKGKALSWADYFITTKQAEQGMLAPDLSKYLDYGTWADFNTAFLEFFQSQDPKKEALRELNMLRMEETVEEHVILFKTLVIKAGYKDDQDISSVINKFELSLPEHIRERLSVGYKTEDIEAWYNNAIKTDNSFRRRNRSFGQNTTTKFKRDFPKARGTPPHYSPNHRSNNNANYWRNSSSNYSNDNSNHNQTEQEEGLGERPESEQDFF